MNVKRHRLKPERGAGGQRPGVSAPEPNGSPRLRPSTSGSQIPTPDPRPLTPRPAGRRHPRKGAFAVIAMVCLLVAGMLIASLLKQALLQERQLNYELARMQAAWLADSALDRAATRLAGEPDYTGETWNIEPARLGGPDAAAVVIQIQNEETQPNHRTIVVEATYPAEGPVRARLTRQATVAVSKEP